ncbi:MAG: APA family basic amino acid/polyamine antiporter [Polaribacter sp.]|jgi:APA family basic amino acid/polyamine antiporter
MSQLKKKLNIYGLTMIAVGACIGSGIFSSPGQVAAAVPNHTLVLAVWALGGVIALTGALTFSELGAMFPKAGGVYVYLKEAYGEMTGFLYGWVILLVINSGALAALAITFADYMTYFIVMTDQVKVVLAAVTIIFLTGINAVGINMSQIFANLFSTLKLIAIAGIILAGFVFYNAEKVPLDFTMASAPENIFNAMLVGLIGVLWSMGGWHHASYLSEEAIDAKRTVPRAMILGVLIVTVMYVLVNLAYMMLLPLPDIAASSRVAGDAVGQVVSFGGKLVAVIIAISIFGTIGIYTMSAPRVYFAMAKDGVFFKGLSKIHPTYGTPVNAMLVQAIWAIVLLLFWGAFEELISYVTFMDIIFMTMAGISIFIFRNKRPAAERPIKALGYPIIPIIFILISTAFVISTFFEKWEQAIGGLIVLGLGLPVYYYFKSQKERT